MPCLRIVDAAVDAAVNAAVDGLVGCVVEEAQQLSSGIRRVPVGRALALALGLSRAFLIIGEDCGMMAAFLRKGDWQSLVLSLKATTTGTH